MIIASRTNALVGAFNQEKAFSVIVKTGRGTDGSFYSTKQDLVPGEDMVSADNNSEDNIWEMSPSLSPQLLEELEEELRTRLLRNTLQTFSTLIDIWNMSALSVFHIGHIGILMKMFDVFH